MAAPKLPTNGAVIRAVRVAYGLKLAELARDLDISEGYLSRLETGKLDGSPHILRRVAERLNIPLAAVVRCAIPDHLLKEPAEAVA